MEQIPNKEFEYFTVGERNGVVFLHIGYYEAELDNKQVDYLIKRLKYYKTHKGEMYKYE